MLLPYLDQAPLYNSLASTPGTVFLPPSFTSSPGIGFGSNAFFLTPSVGLATPLVVFRCPSDIGSPTLTQTASSITVTAGRSNYPGVMGSDDADGAGTSLNSANGAFPDPVVSVVPLCRSFRDFTDGLSNTIIVGERRSPATINGLQIGGDGVWYGLWTGPISVTASCYPAFPLNFKTSGTNNNMAFSSYHVGGGQFLMGDGTVRFISENISSTTYANLASINGGEVLGDF